MKPPLLVVDTGGELTLFNSADEVAGDLEAQDVRDGEYRLFDCAGIEYSLSAETDDSPVVVGGPIDSEPKFDVVRKIATTYLESLPEKVRASSPQVELRTPDELSRALSPYAGQSTGCLGALIGVMFLLHLLVP